MEVLFIFTSILQSVAISLGVGCSTLAILNFFVAIANGQIDQSERKMMGVVYFVLRVAMVLILVTTGFLTFYVDSAVAFLGAVWTLIAVLYLNAFLMTKRIMPSKIGPALQAATWYTLGIVYALVPLGLADFTFWKFILSYVAVIVLAVILVNRTMRYLKSRR